MISVEIRAQEAQRRLNRLAAQLQNRRPVNKILSAKLFAMVMENFDNEAHDGQPWLDLAPSTWRWKRKRGYEKILQNTGALRQSFLPFSDNNSAGVGALSVRKHADISKKHEEGIGVPKRPMLPGRAKALEQAIIIYEAFIERAVR
jgi:phage gpG-like protein